MLTTLPDTVKFGRAASFSRSTDATTTIFYGLYAKSLNESRPPELHAILKLAMSFTLIRSIYR
jgi:hypothetical protein